LDAVITSKSAAIQPSGSSYSSILGSFSSSSSHQQQQPTLSLDDCLKEHTKEEILDAGNEWYCSNCKEHKKAYKIMNFSYHYLPKILILTLKRFEYRDISNLLGSSGGGGGFGGNVHREKIDTFVDFPLVGLNLKQYCGLSTSAATEEGNNNNNNNSGENKTKPSSSSPTKVPTAPAVSRSRLPSMEENALEEELSRQQKKKSEEEQEEQRKQETAVVEETEEEEENDAIYDLFAICNHYGRMGFGHYTATVKEWPLYEEQAGGGQQGGGSSGNWFLYDDNSVTKISEREVKTSSAYILFYRKRNSN
jgi:ubiquitin C-terminal hydrolase